MCLIAFALAARPGLPLLLAANRDEFFERPTAGLHRWSLSDGTQVLAGRDLREGGTWLGVSTSGRVAMLTNVRSVDMAGAHRSRGELVTHWLGSGFCDVQALAAAIEPQAYGGFNLVVGDLCRGGWAFISNRDPADPHGHRVPALWQQELGPGVYGLSNASLNSEWPKTRLLRSVLTDTLDEAHEPNGQWQPPLQRALGSRLHAQSIGLPHTGAPPELERALASPFVHMPERGYGTRSSLIMGAWQSGHRWTLTMDEWRHEHEGSPMSAPVWDASRRRRESLYLGH